jgi:hypothetical protein
LFGLLENFLSFWCIFSNNQPFSFKIALVICYPSFSSASVSRVHFFDRLCQNMLSGFNAMISILISANWALFQSEEVDVWPASLNFRGDGLTVSFSTRDCSSNSEYFNEEFRHPIAISRHNTRATTIWTCLRFSLVCLDCALKIHRGHIGHQKDMTEVPRKLLSGGKTVERALSFEKCAQLMRIKTSHSILTELVQAIEKTNGSRSCFPWGFCYENRISFSFDAIHHLMFLWKYIQERNIPQGCLVWSEI